MDYNFIEVIQNFNRMCNKYYSHCSVRECPIAELIKRWEIEHEDDWTRNCITFAREEPEEFADCVMTWAQDNPVAIYPTIGEVVRKICALMNIDPHTSINTICDERLTEETAKYFGIEPINKDKLV